MFAAAWATPTRAAASLRSPVAWSKSAWLIAWVAIRFWGPLVVGFQTG